MKPIILLLFAGILQAQGIAQTCNHVFRWAPQGAFQTFRNGVLQDDTALTYTSTTRTVTPNQWADGDKMVYIYIREIDNSQHVPPSWYSAPIKETQVCTGNQNPLPVINVQSGPSLPDLSPYVTEDELANQLNNYVPYKGAVMSVDLGAFSLITQSLTTTKGGGSLIYLVPANPVPTSTTDDQGIQYAGVLYFDPADNLLKILTLSGSVVTLGTPTAPAPAPSRKAP